MPNRRTPLNADSMDGGRILAVVEPAKPKAIVADTSHGLEIVIPAKRNWFLTIFLGFWLCGWAMGEIMVPLAFFSGDLDHAALVFTAVWLVMWTVGGGFAIYIFLWSLAGRERVLISPAILSVKRELFGFGRVREYELAHVSDLRSAPSTYNPFDFRSGLQFWGIGGGTVAFDHGASTVRFGASLEEGEAKSLVETLRSRTSVGRTAV